MNPAALPSPDVPEVPHTLTGILILTIMVLSTVITYLFKLYVSRGKEAADALEKKDAALEKKDVAIVAERIEFARGESSWEQEARRLEADYERGLKEKAVAYAAELAEMREQYLEREDAMRKDFGDRVERITNEMSRAAQEQVKLNDKMFERFVGPRRGPQGIR